MSLTGLWFKESRIRPAVEQTFHLGENALFSQTKRWLDCYFSGKDPEKFSIEPPKIHLEDTPFRLEVWSILQTIPYGKTLSYKEIATEIAARRGLKALSAQAVGGAVGHNPISIIIPCHRVIGSDGSLVGYAGGIEKKKALLKIEGCMPV